ncbi:asparaginase domain-containing protein [Litoribrevibacter albus]|uniref:Asparaginase n=1 Tax=Litoribrevibacter albus TaxID=1473156 RepID=A0AA37SCY1_9GAMM|nr:asparaginase domain-containing protein [Litoribrevibacter albus]GLQ32087.1 asparaginase [Litoribrevibacter albus]
MKIDIFCAGGTIDKIYFDAKSDYQVGEPKVGRILEAYKLNIDFEVHSVLRKDSLEMDDQDRQTLKQAISQCDNEYILVTHGTDTMPETAEVLKDLPNKTIVMFGAMEPAMYKTSDAEFNAGCAVGAVQSLPNGVYIAMSGRIFEAGKVKKNVAEGIFEIKD